MPSLKPQHYCEQSQTLAPLSPRRDDAGLVQIPVVNSRENQFGLSEEGGRQRAACASADVYAQQISSSVAPAEKSCYYPTNRPWVNNLLRRALTANPRHKHLPTYPKIRQKRWRNSVTFLQRVWIQSGRMCSVWAGGPMWQKTAMKAEVCAALCCQMCGAVLVT